jgi:hypothetical protein
LKKAVAGPLMGFRGSRVQILPSRFPTRSTLGTSPVVLFASRCRSASGRSHRAPARCRRHSGYSHTRKGTTGGEPAAGFFGTGHRRSDTAIVEGGPSQREGGMMGHLSRSAHDGPAPQRWHGQHNSGCGGLCPTAGARAGGVVHSRTAPRQTPTLRHDDARPLRLHARSVLVIANTFRVDDSRCCHRASAGRLDGVRPLGFHGVANRFRRRRHEPRACW